MTFNHYYIFGMALIHGGLFYSLHKGLGERARPGWRMAAYAACTVFVASRLPGIYLVLPALWWPGGVDQFVDEAVICLAATLVSLVVSVVPRKDKKSEPGSKKETGSAEITEKRTKAAGSA